MQKITRSVWNAFQDSLFKGEPVNEDLFLICIDHFPFQLDQIQEKTISLCAALELHYELQISYADVQQFLNRVALGHKARPYLQEIEDEKDVILAELLEEDARNRTYDQIALAGRLAEDIFGTAYLAEFYNRT